MKKFFIRMLTVIAALGIGGMGTKMALEKNGIDPAAAGVVSNLVEQEIDRAADKYGSEESE